MRSRIVAPFVCFVLTAGSTAAQQAPADRDRQAIAALIEDVQAANNDGDVDRWVSLFARNFVYMAPGSAAVATREVLTEVAQAGFQHNAAVDIRPLEIEVHGDWAFARTEVTGTVTLHGSGRVVQVNAKQLVIYEKMEDGTWRIARLMSNSNTQ